MTLPFDTYNRQARLYPALVAVAPALALILTLISWTGIDPSQFVATLAIGVLLFVFADFARYRGRQIEPRIYASLGGKPSTTMLRHRNTELHADSKARYVAFLASRLREPVPTPAQETADPMAADAFYERCGDWLRENTRNRAQFPLLFKENVTYGFRRNLLGMKRIAFFLNAFVLVIAGFLTFGPYRDYVGLQLNTFLFVLVVAGIHAAFLLFFVNEDWVRDAAKTYARQLLFSCEHFFSLQSSPS